MCNAYSELNDPIDQRERFKAQEEALAAGDEEANTTDKLPVQDSGTYPPSDPSCRCSRCKPDKVKHQCLLPMRAVQQQGRS